MRDKIYCDYISSDSLEFSFNDFKTVGFNTAEAFRYRLKRNGKVKDSIPFYKITKKNDTVFEIKVFDFTKYAQRKNRKLKAGRCLLLELIFKNDHVIQMNEKRQIYSNRNYRNTKPPFIFDTTLYTYNNKNQLTSTYKIHKDREKTYFIDGTSIFKIDSINCLFEYNHKNQMVKYCTYRNNELTYKSEWQYNRIGFLEKLIVNSFNNSIEYYAIDYKYDSSENKKLISEYKVSKHRPNFGIKYDSTQINYIYKENKLVNKKIECYASYFEKNYQVSSYEIQEFDTLGNVICRLFKNKKDSITSSLYCNYEFQHGKLTSEKFFYDKFGVPFQENKYNFYPNGFLKENKSIVGKNLNYLYRYYYK